MGEPTRNDCPVCGKDKLVLLAYVYGDGLKQENGRVWSLDTGLRMAAAHPGACCYVVEVCRTLPVEPPPRGLHGPPRGHGLSGRSRNSTRTATPRSAPSPGSDSIGAT